MLQTAAHCGPFVRSAMMPKQDIHDDREKRRLSHNCASRKSPECSPLNSANGLQAVAAANEVVQNKTTHKLHSVL